MFYISCYIDLRFVSKDVSYNSKIKSYTTLTIYLGIYIYQHCIYILVTYDACVKGCVIYIVAQRRRAIRH